MSTPVWHVPQVATLTPGSWPLEWSMPMRSASLAGVTAAIDVPEYEGMSAFTVTIRAGSWTRPAGMASWDGFLWQP